MILCGQMGGMQLEKEQRALVTYLSSISTWSIRERFSRLQQIALLLDLEHVQLHVHVKGLDKSNGATNPDQY